MTDTRDLFFFFHPLKGGSWPAKEPGSGNFLASRPAHPCQLVQVKEEDVVACPPHDDP